MAKSPLLYLRQVAWLVVVLAGTIACATPQDLLDRLNDDGEPGPVTMKGPLAGFIATPQVFDFGPVSALVIAPDQRWFAAYSAGGVGIRVMDMRTGVLLRVLRTAGREITGLSISWDSRVIGAIDRGGKPLVWDVATGEKLGSGKLPAEIARIEGLTDYITAAERDSSKGNRIVEFLRRRGLSEQQLSTFERIEGVVTSVDGRYAVILDDKSSETISEGEDSYRALKIWDLRRRSDPLIVKIPDDWCGRHVSAFAYHGRHFVLGTNGGNHVYTDSAAFEVKDGTARALWHTECTVDHDAPEEISQDARFYTVGAAPNGPITVWDLGRAQRAAYFEEDVFVAPIISADGSTFAVLKDATGGRFVLVLRHGKLRRLDARVDADPTGPKVHGVYALSPNGRYFAATIVGTSPGERKSVGIWDTDSARQINRIEPADERGPSWKIAGVSDAGSVLLLSDSSVFKSGKWHQLPKAERSLIVPLTPTFQPVCGVIFCDRVMTDFGVVERVLPKDAEIDREQIRIGAFLGRTADQSADGRLIRTVGRDGVFHPSFAVVEVATGRTLLRETSFIDFTADSRHVLSGSPFGGSPFTLQDISTGKRIWSLHGTPNLGFVMIFSNGRVRASPGAEQYVKLVRGFEVKPFDDAARRQFGSRGGLEPW